MRPAAPAPARPTCYWPSPPYVLTFKTSVHGGKFRTLHIFDVPLVFAHREHPILGDVPARCVVSRQMSKAWAAFARTGDPNLDLLPSWPLYNKNTRATMYFNDPPSLMHDPRTGKRGIW